MVKCAKCDKQACFNLAGEINGKYCASHKTPEMVDVKHPKCRHPGCDSRPSFNITGSKIGMYCFVHKTPEMVNVRHSKCQHTGCDKISPVFNVLDVRLFN